MLNTKKPKKDFYVSMAARLTTKKITIEKIIERAIGKKAIKTERLLLGVGNEVYKIWSSTDKSPDYILRIHHGEHPQFKLEKWSFESVAKFGVPSPQIIDIGTIGDHDNLLTYCLESVIPGVSLESLLDAGITETERINYAVQAGEMLGRIHQVPTRGHGHLKSNGVGTYNTLYESMQQHDDISDLILACRDTEMNERSLNKAVGIIDTVKEIDSTPHLVHVDYAPKHIFIHKGKISGVIDFELCLSGYAATDFNRWRAQESRISIEELLHGYRNVRPIPSDFWEFMFIVQLHSALRTMLYHERISHNDEERIKAAAEATSLLRKGTALRV